jgi:hypothetical protein
MATGNGVDLRRSDLRSNVLENPYWITSAEMVAADIDTYDAVLFSFPIGAAAVTNPSAIYGNNLICIHAFALEVVTAVTGGTAVITIGLGSLVTDDACGTLAAPGTDDVTDITVDNFLQDGDLAEATPGFYSPQLTGAAYGVAIGAMADFDTGNTAIAVTPADGTVICVVAYQTGTPTAGSYRVNMLISEVPSGR